MPRAVDGSESDRPHSGQVASFLALAAAQPGQAPRLLFMPAPVLPLVIVRSVTTSVHTFVADAVRSWIEFHRLTTFS
jgi:hypothetical protein